MTPLSNEAEPRFDDLKIHKKLEDDPARIHSRIKSKQLFAKGEETPQESIISGKSSSLYLDPLEESSSITHNGGRSKIEYVSKTLNNTLTPLSKEVEPRFDDPKTHRKPENDAVRLHSKIGNKQLFTRCIFCGKNRHPSVWIHSNNRQQATHAKLP